MASKRVSAYDQALIEAQKPPASAAPIVLNPLAPAPASEQSVEVSEPPKPTFEEVAPAFVSTALAQPETAVRPVGRPRGKITKVKKTFYLSDGAENLRQSQIELVKQAGLFLKDESEVAELALAVLRSMLNDKGDLERVLAVREALAQRGS